MNLITQCCTGILLALLIVPTQAQEISGAGSSAAKPLYTKWAELYAKQGQFKLNYKASGSGDGIKQIKARTVDFGASDLALSAAELRHDKLVTFPTAVSGVVPVVNLAGVKQGELRLTGEVLADIFARKITQWNDAALLALNPGLNLPKSEIRLLVREGGSGTTYNFSDYLSTVSPAWKSGPGRGLSIKWPEGAQAFKSSDEVVAALKQSQGAITYVDYKYVAQDKLNFVQLKNRDGKFVAPNARSFATALANSAWRSAGSFEESLVQRPGSGSWPITAGTFALMSQTAKNPTTTIATLKFFTWAFIKGDHAVDGSEFVALPDAVQARIFVDLLKITDVNGKPLDWKPM